MGREWCFGASFPRFLSKYILVTTTPFFSDTGLWHRFCSKLRDWLFLLLRLADETRLEIRTRGYVSKNYAWHTGHRESLKHPPFAPLFELILVRVERCNPNSKLSTANGYETPKVLWKLWWEGDVHSGYVWGVQSWSSNWRKSNITDCAKKMFPECPLLTLRKCPASSPQRSSVHVFILGEFVKPPCVLQRSLRWLFGFVKWPVVFLFRCLQMNTAQVADCTKKKQLHLSNGEVKRCWLLDDLDVHGKVNRSLSFPMVDDIHQLNSRAVYTPL